MITINLSELTTSTEHVEVIFPSLVVTFTSVFPTATAVIRPVDETDATDVFKLVHVKFLFSAVPGLIIAVSCFVCILSSFMLLFLMYTSVTAILLAVKLILATLAPVLVIVALAGLNL